MMKRISIVAAAFFLVIPGCRNSQEKKMPVIPALVMHAPKPETNQNPYYHGLIEEFSTILQEDPNNFAATIGLANAYADSGLWQEAIHQYEHALKIHPGNADVHADMGTAYRNIGMPDRALAEYRVALGYDPGHLNARYKMGVVYAFDLRKYGVAVHIWEELLRLAPAHPHAEYMRTCIVTFRKTMNKEHR